MTGNYRIREVKEGEEARVCALVERVFNEFEAPGYSDEGIKEFFDYANPNEMQVRLEAGCILLLAEEGQIIIGMIEFRTKDHISLLFVDANHHGCGIGRALFERAVSLARIKTPNLQYITVNSSPYAKDIYERLGFIATDSEQVVNGIRFIPMIYEIGE